MELTDTLNDVSARRFRVQNRLAIAFMTLSKHVMDDEGISVQDVMAAQLNSLVSTVQAVVPPLEWADVGAQLAVSLQERLTITGER